MIDPVATQTQPNSMSPQQPLSRRGISDDSRPVPDPTELTDRAIARLRDELTSQFAAQLAIRDERLRGIDEATSLLRTGANRIEGLIDEKVSHLKALHDERFDSIALQFRERDTRSERESRDNKVAVDAAFAAQKEAAAKQDETNLKAIDKSERATAEAIKTNLELTRATTDALTKGLDEVKGRVTVVEATKQGVADQRASSVMDRTGVYQLVSFIGIGVGILGVVAALVRAGA